jgi:hypothetical protein
MKLGHWHLRDFPNMTQLFRGRGKTGTRATNFCSKTFPITLGTSILKKKKELTFTLGLN